MSPRRIAPLAALCLFAISLAVAAAGRPPTPVQVAEVARVNLAPQQWVPATVVARREARLAAETAARLRHVAEVGERLVKGAVAARLDDTYLRLRVEELSASETSDQARLTYLSKEQVRLRRLAKQNNAAQTRLDEVQADRVAAEQALAVTRARLRQAAEELLRSTLRAPFAGVVAERLRQPGEWAGSGDPVLRLVDTTALEVRASVPLSVRGLVRPGGQLPLRDAEGGERPARVRALVAVGDGPSHRLDLRLIPAGEGWTIGQPLQVAVPTAAPREVLAVPRDALVLRSAGAAVFRIDGENHAERIPVRLGIASGALIAVEGALAPGDRVVVRGGERLRPGQAVRILDGAAD